MAQLNKFYIKESSNFMRENLPNDFVDLTITSPPYDKLRKYNGFVFDYRSIAKDLFRITKQGGVVVWIVGDETSDFCESLSSFKQAIYFVDDAGFKLLDTMIYQKKNVPPTYPNMKRYIPSFEYMFIFSKGKPKCFNPIKDRKNLYAGEYKSGDTQRQKDGSTKKVRGYVPQEFGMRFNSWTYDVGKNKDTRDTLAFKHPARFPEKLAEDHILSWSNKDDVVFDPMCGSGTTCKMAYLNNRNFIGVDTSEEYINQICIPRLEQFGWINQ